MRFSVHSDSSTDADTDTDTDTDSGTDTDTDTRCGFSRLVLSPFSQTCHVLLQTVALVTMAAGLYAVQKYKVRDTVCCEARGARREDFCVMMYSS